MVEDEGKWFASPNEEDFSEGPYETREDAIRLAPIDGKYKWGTSFWTGRLESVDLPTVDPDWVIEHAADEMIGEAGEAAKNWMADVDGDLMRELEQQLTHVFHSWLRRHEYEPSFGVVRDVRVHCVNGGELVT